MIRDYEWPWRADRQSCRAIGRYTYKACQQLLGHMTDSLSPNYGMDVDWLPAEQFVARTCSRGVEKPRATVQAVYHRPIIFQGSGNGFIG